MVVRMGTGVSTDYDLCGKKKYKPYTHFWTERWADRLGGVRR